MKLKVTTAVVAATSLAVLTNVSPAFAEGAGVSVGHSTIVASGPIETPLCIQTVANPVITLTNVGTIGAVGNPDGVAEFAGVSIAEFELDRFYFGPHGTFEDDGDPECAHAVVPPLVPAPEALVPQPIDVTGWSVDGDTTVDGVHLEAHCSGDDGSYLRVTNAYTITVSGTCTVVETSIDGVVLQVTNAPTTFVFSGNQNPCLEDFGIPNCTPPLQETEFEGVYAQLPV